MPSAYVPQSPAVAHPAAQPAALYSPPLAAGKVVVELGAVVSTSQV